MTVYQAVAEFWTSEQNPGYDLNVDILLPGRSKPVKYNFNSRNHFATRTSKVRTIILKQFSGSNYYEINLLYVFLLIRLFDFKSLQINNINQDVTVVATGLGEATVTVSEMLFWVQL